MENKLNKSKRINRIRNNTLFSGCIHQDEYCDKSICKAHSIQNNGILNRLSRDGNVMAIDFSKICLDNGIKLHEVGRGKASTFTGFCNYHDSNIFKPIEYFGYKPNDKEQNFLFSYRAFALGYYERHSAYQMMKANLEGDLNRINTRLEKKIALYNNHLKVIEKIRTIMNTNLDNKRFDRIMTDVLIWPNEYGISSTSMFFIGNDNEGRKINDSSNYLSPFFFTIFPQIEFTYVLLSYFTKDKLIYQFIKDQIVGLCIEEQKITISNIIALYIENIFFSPDYWDHLPISTKEKYCYIYSQSMGRKKPAKLTAFKGFNLFV